MEAEAPTTTASPWNLVRIRGEEGLAAVRRDPMNVEAATKSAARAYREARARAIEQAPQAGPVRFRPIPPMDSKSG
jgi:hypothetical protein